jgi:hypothetical protein
MRATKVRVVIDDESQGIIYALAMGLELMRSMPAHRLRPGMTHDVDQLLFEITRQQPEKALRVARGHLKALGFTPRTKGLASQLCA